MRKYPFLLLSLLAPAFGAHAQSAPPPANETRPRVVNAATPARTTPGQTTGQATTAAPTPPARSTTAPAATPVPRVTPAATPSVTATLPAPSTAAPVFVTPSAAVVPAAPLQPARPQPLSKVRAHLTEARRLLQTRVALTASSTPSTGLVTLAALDPGSSQVHLLTLPKQTLLTRGADVSLASSLGATLRLRVVRPNYVNTSVVIFDLAGRQLVPLLIEYPIEKFGRFREMAYYASAHPALVTPEVVKAGQTYVRTMHDLAAKRLKDKGQHVAPELVDIAERLCVVEHVDHERFRNESRLAIYEDVYALYGLNELDTYRYSVSSAGAGGMVQMIPWAYNHIRQTYPAVGLNPDFVAGMRNHGNALEAMLLYIQFTWNSLRYDPDITYALTSGLATQAEILAAGYNSNAARLPGYVRRGGASWRYLIPRETQMYLQIYKSFEGLVPLKKRADKS